MEYGISFLINTFFLCILTVSSNLPVPVSGLMPAACLSNLTYFQDPTHLLQDPPPKRPVDGVVCCPTPRGHRTACGFPERGECQKYHNSHFAVSPEPQFPFNTDIRRFWPLRFVQRMCHCRFPFTGADCGQCWFGWRGENCDQREQIHIRRNVFTYTSTEKKLFRDILLRMHEKPSDMIVLVEEVPEGKSTDASTLRSPGVWVNATMHEALIFIHYLAQRPLLTNSVRYCTNTLEWNHYTDYNHQGPGFISWHRHFMNLWESWARDIAREEFGQEDFTFPYWDWTDRFGCEVCTDDLVGAAGRDDRLSEMSPFYNWTVFCAEVVPKHDCAPCHAGRKDLPLKRTWRSQRFPATIEVNATLIQPGFDVYEKYDRDRFVYPELSQIISDVPTIRCGYFAMRMEGMCPNPGSEKNTTSTNDDAHLYMHNRVHNICNGTFHSGRTSPNDPLFVLHHTQIDRLFQTWIRRNKAGPEAMPVEEWHVGQCRQCPMVGYFPPVVHGDMLVDSRQLGYDYDNYVFGTTDYAPSPASRGQDS